MTYSIENAKNLTEKIKELYSIFESIVGNDIRKKIGFKEKEVTDFVTQMNTLSENERTEYLNNFGSDMKGGGISIPSEELCTDLLFLMLIANKQTSAEFDAIEFLDKVHDLFDTLGGQCELITEVLEKVLHAIMLEEADAWEEGYSLIPLSIEDDSLSILEHIQNEKENGVKYSSFEGLLPPSILNSRVIPRPIYEYETLIGTSPYLLIPPTDPTKDTPLLRLAEEAEPILLEPDDIEGLEKKGESLTVGELLSFYVIALNEAYNQKCPLNRHNRNK
jgi:hypothetical protein